MTNKDIDKISELLQEMAKVGMHAAIDASWDKSETELMKLLIDFINTPNNEENPGPFALMQVVGLTGTVLSMKFKVDEKELMQLLKDSNVNFVKEIK